MVIRLLAPFLRLLSKRDCQHDLRLVGDFLRLAVGDRPAKSLKGLRGASYRCGVLHGQMAKVEPRETVRKVPKGLALKLQNSAKRVEEALIQC